MNLGNELQPFWPKLCDIWQHLETKYVSMAEVGKMNKDLNNK